MQSPLLQLPIDEHAWAAILFFTPTIQNLHLERRRVATQQSNGVGIQNPYCADTIVPGVGEIRCCADGISTYRGW